MKVNIVSARCKQSEVSEGYGNCETYYLLDTSELECKMVRGRCFAFQWLNNDELVERMNNLNGSNESFVPLSSGNLKRGNERTLRTKSLGLNCERMNERG